MNKENVMLVARLIEGMENGVVKFTTSNKTYEGTLNYYILAVMEESDTYFSNVEGKPVTDGYLRFLNMETGDWDSVRTNDIQSILDEPVVD